MILYINELGEFIIGILAMKFVEFFKNLFGMDDESEESVVDEPESEPVSEEEVEEEDNSDMEEVVEDAVEESEEEDKEDKEEA